MFRFILIFLASVCFADLLSAQDTNYNEKINRLLRQARRPTVAQFKRVMSPMPEENPFPVYQLGWDRTHDSLARAIAEIEFKYPGAIILPLGRDIVALGDMLDAFYLANGQEGRVRRFDASGPTIRGADKDEILAYLRTLGFELSKIRQNPPFILIDGTSGVWDSQMVIIRNAVYEGYLEMGGKIEDIFQKFNIVNTSPYTGIPIQKPLHGISVRPSELQKTFFTLSVAPFVPSIRFWHGTFGPFKVSKNGNINSSLPAENRKYDERVLVLGEMYEMVKAASDPLVLKLVKQEARKLGYRFSLNNRCNDALSE